MKEGKYIYSIVQETNNRSFGPIGINNREINLVHYKDIAVVVSPTPIIHFDRFSKEELTKHVATHQRVNEVLMKDYDVVPMAFGTIAQSQAEVLGILEKAYLQFKTALKKISGKIEFAVQIFWDEKKFLEGLLNSNQEIKQLKKEAESKGLIGGIGAKLKLGKMTFEQAEKRRKDYLKEIKDWLKECSLDFKEGKLVNKTMIGNISFLIEKKGESEFDRKMQELGPKYGDNLRFKYVGPMPPYSFVNINLSLGNFEAVEEARKLLGLGEEASLDEIKKAYYALSHKYHPDKYGGEPETAEKMKKIVEAYSILKNYCQSCDEFEGNLEGRKYSFREEDVENSLIIK